MNLTMDAMKEHDREVAIRQLERFDASVPTVADLGVLSELLSQPYQWLRIRSAELLGSVNDAAAVRLLAIALNDRCEHVAVAAATSLAKIRTVEALDVLRRAFADGELERPHHLANAIAAFGDEGFALLDHFSRAKSATLRYFAARGLGSTGKAEAVPILESMREDLEKTAFGGQVATAAKDALRTLHRVQTNASAILG
jgi:HEAT repeat protein